MKASNSLTIPRGTPTHTIGASAPSRYTTASVRTPIRSDWRTWADQAAPLNVQRQSQEAGNESGKSVTPSWRAIPLKATKTAAAAGTAACAGDAEEWSEATRKPEVAKLLVPLGSGGEQAQDDASKNERGFAHEQVVEHCVVWQTLTNTPTIAAECHLVVTSAHQSGGADGHNKLINRSPSRSIPALNKTAAGTKKAGPLVSSNPKAPRGRANGGGVAPPPA